MPKHKFNLVGNTFNYTDAPRCSVWGKESKHTEWVNEGGEGTFYIDNAISLGKVLIDVTEYILLCIIFFFL